MTNRRLGFDEDNWEPVHQQHEICASLGRSCAEGELIGDHVLVVLDVIEVDEPDGGVLVVRSEWHRAVAT